jgi:hypothetical protein
MEHAPLITNEHVRLIKAAQRDNDQVGGKAVRVPPALELFQA